MSETYSINNSTKSIDPSPGRTGNTKPSKKVAKVVLAIVGVVALIVGAYCLAHYSVPVDHFFSHLTLGEAYLYFFLPIVLITLSAVAFKACQQNRHRCNSRKFVNFFHRIVIRNRCLGQD